MWHGTQQYGHTHVQRGPVCRLPMRLTMRIAELARHGLSTAQYQHDAHRTARPTKQTCAQLLATHVCRDSCMCQVRALSVICLWQNARQTMKLLDWLTCILDNKRSLFVTIEYDESRQLTINDPLCRHTASAACNMPNETLCSQSNSLELVLSEDGTGAVKKEWFLGKPQQRFTSKRLSVAGDHLHVCRVRQNYLARA